jgi:hypothetical protein
MAWVNTSPLVKTYTLEEFWALPDSPDHSKLELLRVANTRTIHEPTRNQAPSRTWLFRVISWIVFAVL